MLLQKYSIWTPAVEKYKNYEWESDDDNDALRNSAVKSIVLLLEKDGVATEEIINEFRSVNDEEAFLRAMESLDNYLGTKGMFLSNSPHNKKGKR